MRKFLCLALSATVALMAMVGCSCNDDAVWEKVNGIEDKVNKNREDIATLTALIEAMNGGKMITATEQTEDGVVITFSDGTSVLIKNGRNGENGEDGDSLFESIEETEDEVIITLTDGRVIHLPKSGSGNDDQGGNNNGGYELRILTFEDGDAGFASYTLDYASKEITTWSDLIDDAQYGGSLLYGDYGEHTYYWYDEGNTELYHSFTTPYWGGGGHAVSNYVVKDYITLPEGCNGWYELQLATPNGGHDGSRNFAIHNGYVDDFNQQIYTPGIATLEFADGVERTIDHMWVMNTCYVLNSLTCGDGFSGPAIETTSLKIVAIGYNSSDEEVGSIEFALCDNGVPVTEWTKWDMSSLGKVAKIAFNFAASDDLIGEWGLSCPAYFAYDDVTVRFEKQI